MNRKEFVRRVASVMRENNIRKPISDQKQVFHISDNEGNVSDFIIKKSNKGVLFTVDDIDAILDAYISVVEEALKQGDSISIRGFGTLALHYRKARTTKHPDTGESIVIADHYVPKFTSGKDLRICAKIFEMNLNEPHYTYDDIFDDEGGVNIDGD